MAQRRLRSKVLTNVLLPLAGGTAITAAALAGFVLWADVPLAPAGRSIDATGALPAGETAGGAAELVAAPDRNVTPDGVTPGPRIEGPLLRAAPEAGDRRADPEPETIYRRVVVLDGSHFRTVRDRTPIVVRIAGIEAPEFAKTCTDPDGKVWKCGARARAELARLIVNRSVACVVVDETDPAAPVGRCRVGSFDLADWMVRRGWAAPAADAGPELRAAGEEARRSRRGLHGPAPSGVIAG